MKLAATRYRVLAILWRKRYYFILPLILLPLAGFFIANSLPIKYTAKTTILLQESALINPVLSDLSLHYNLEERFKALKILIRSRELLLKIAEQSGVTTAEDPTWKKLWYTAQIKQNLVINRAGDELVRFSMQWHDAKQLKRILELLSATFTQRLTQPNLESRSSASAFLQTQIEHQNKQLQFTEYQLSNYQTTHLSKLPLLFTNRAEIQSEITTQLQVKQQALFTQKNQLEKLHKILSDSDPVVIMAKRQLNQLKKKRLQVSSKYTAKHSKLKLINQQINSLQLQMLNLEKSHKINDVKSISNIEQLWYLVNNINKKHSAISIPTGLIEQLERHQKLQDDVAFLINQIATLKQQLTDHQKYNSDYIRIEYALNSLTDNVQQQRAILFDLQSRYEMAKISQALGQFETTDVVRILQSPILANQNSLPAPYLYAFIGLVIALIQTILLCVIMSLTQDKIWFTTDIASLTKIPIICSIPYIEIIGKSKKP